MAIRKARGVFELVLFDADGKNPRALLSERSILLTPAWRPDGKEILVTSYRGGRPEIWAYRLADRNFRRLSSVTNAMGGVYSPDGSRIAFTASDGGNADVWIMNADGSGARKLTNQASLDLSRLARELLRDVLTDASVRNAMVTHAAFGGSTDYFFGDCVSNRIFRAASSS